MKHLKYILAVLLLLPGITGFGQKGSSDFFYYKGNRFYIQRDNRSIGLLVETNNDAGYVRSLFANTGQQLSPVQEDYTRGSVQPADRQALNRKQVKTWYLELTGRSRNEQEYHAALENHRNLPLVIMASPCYISQDGQRMGLSNNFYVKLKDKSGIDALYQQAEKWNLEVLGYNEFMPLWFTVSCGKATKMNALQAANLFYETGLFEAAEPAFMYHDLLSTNDTYYNNQWGLRNTGQWGAQGVGIDLKVEQAWTVTTGSPNIRTAIFDHGFEMNHPDLAGNTFGTGYDAETNTTPSVVRGSHGTACAGITGAVQNNGIGVSGVAPGTRLMSVSISLLFSNTPQMLANGFNWSWQNGAAVISNSWGGYAPSTIIEDAINNALNNGRGGLGTVVVFAAGNENNTNIRYPGGAIPRILCVGALSPCGERKNPSSCDGEGWGSCYGTQLDIMAPGVKIPTTDRQGANGYDGSDYTQTFNGTSSACPAAAGVAALVLSANPNLTVQQVTDIIEQTAQKVRTDLYTYSTTGGRPNGTWNNEMGYGLANAYQAVLAAQALNCQANITVTAPVVAPNTDTRQASGNITAVNLINSGARGIYHAGGSVILNPGFNANYGSGFKAYIEGCTGSFIYRQATEQVVYSFRENAPVQIAAAAPPADRLTALPNPFGSQLQVTYRFTNGNSRAELAVYSAMGVQLNAVTIAAKAPGATETFTWNTAQWPSGAYTLVLTSGTEKIVKKLVKQ